MRRLDVAALAGMPAEERLEEIYAANTATRAEVEQYYAELRERQREAGVSGAMSDEERRAARLDRLTRLAGVPERYQHVTPNLTRNAQLQEGRGLWICGPVGVGKTHDAVALLRGWISLTGGGARFVSSPSLLSELRGTYDGEGSEQAVVGKYARASLLVLDDLGKEAPTPWSLAKLYELLDARWGARVPTIVTSNQRPDELARRLAEAGDAETAKSVVSRLAGTCDMVLAQGRDRRMA